MRIVHEITNPMSGTVGGRAYCNRNGFQGYSGSMQVDVLICSDCAANHPELPAGMFREEAIYIEGDSKYIIDALESAIRQLKMLEEHEVKRLGENRPSLCPNCTPEDNQPNVMHTTECPQHVNHKLFHPDSSE